MSPAGARVHIGDKDSRVEDWSQDGRHVLVRSRYSLSLYDMASGSTRPLVGGGAVFLGPARFSPDGQSVFYHKELEPSSTKSVGAVITLEGQELFQMNRDFGANRAEWSADGRFFAYGPDQFYRADTGALEHVLSAAARSFAWAPFGNLAAYTRQIPEGNINCGPRRDPAAPRGSVWDLYLFDPDTHGERYLITLPDGCRGSTPFLTWSPDARFIAMWYSNGL